MIQPPPLLLGGRRLSRVLHESQSTADHTEEVYQAGLYNICLSVFLLNGHNTVGQYVTWGNGFR